MFLFQFYERNLLTKGGVQVNLDTRAMARDPIDILLHYAFGQTKSRDAPNHHATEPIASLVNMNLITRLGEVMRRG